MLDKNDINPRVAALKQVLAAFPQIAHELDQSYCRRVGIKRDADSYAKKIGEEYGEVMHYWLSLNGERQSDGLTETQMRDGVAEQVIDVFMQLMSLSRTAELDLVGAIERKYLRFLPEITEAA